MPCLLGLLALVAPRLVLVLLWIFSNYVGDACETVIWPFLGFLFMPVTTLAYAWAWHLEPQGSIQGLGTVVVVIAVLLDLGIIGGNAKKKAAAD